MRVVFALLFPDDDFTNDSSLYEDLAHNGIVAWTTSWAELRNMERWR